MLSKSWLSIHFVVHGNKLIHYGLFEDCKESVEIILQIILQIMYLIVVNYTIFNI